MTAISDCLGGCSASEASPAAVFSRLDEIVHQRTRLGLLCVLRWRGEQDFNSLREILRLSDGNLARHITVLKAADLVVTDKRTEGRRRRTYIELTGLGSEALDTQLRAMGDIIAFNQECESVAMTQTRAAG